MALDVQEAKKNIAEALGDKASRYWELMKNWYRKKVSFSVDFHILINAHYLNFVNA